MPARRRRARPPRRPQASRGRTPRPPSPGRGGRPCTARSSGGSASTQVPQAAARDQRGLHDLGVARAQLRGGQRGEQRRIGDHGGRLVERARVVLAFGKVDSGLSPVRRVDLRDHGGRHLDHRHAALVGRRAEAREVAHDAAAEGQQRVAALHPGPRQRAQHALGLGDRLVVLAGRDGDRSSATSTPPDSAASRRSPCSASARSSATTKQRPPPGHSAPAASSAPVPT